MKNFYNYNEFKDMQQLNEGLFGKLLGWAGDLIKQGKIKAALQKYKDEYPIKFKEGLEKQFAIEIAKNNKKDTKLLEQELANIEEEKKIIKDELDTAIAEVLRKKPDLKLKLQKFKLQAEKENLQTLNNVLKELSKNQDYIKLQKYKEVQDLIKERDAELEKNLKNINSNKIEFVETGIYNYTTEKGIKQIIIITKIEKDDKEVIKKIEAKAIQKQKEKNGEPEVDENGTPIMDDIIELDTFKTDKPWDRTEKRFNSKIEIVDDNQELYQKYIDEVKKGNDSKNVAPQPGK